MFNLLPDNLKQKIRNQYWFQLIEVLLAVLIFLLVTSIVFLFPSWLMSLQKQKDITNQGKKTNLSALESEINVINSKIQSINAKVTVVNTNLEYPKISPILNNLLLNKTKDIQIKEFQYVTTNATSGKLVVGGIAATRESLVSFVKTLENSEIFKNINLPISNLTKDKDIVFSITMTIISQNENE